MPLRRLPYHRAGCRWRAYFAAAVVTPRPTTVARIRLPLLLPFDGSITAPPHDANYNHCGRSRRAPDLPHHHYAPYLFIRGRLWTCHWTDATPVAGTGRLVCGTLPLLPPLQCYQVPTLPRTYRPGSAWHPAAGLHPPLPPPRPPRTEYRGDALRFSGCWVYLATPQHSMGRDGQRPPDGNLVCGNAIPHSLADNCAFPTNDTYLWRRMTFR